jgi:CRISPR-associated exonuclease Cas4
MATLYLGLTLLLIAGALFILAGRQRRRTGLPGGRVVYADTRFWEAVEKPLYDAELGLTGKPDYLVEQDGRLIPVEVKSGRTPEAPFDSHIYQLAAYCLLVQKTTGKRPPHGILHYPRADFAVDYTPELEAALLALLAEMRRAGRRPTVKRSHSEAQRCRLCGFRKTCDEKLS